MLRFAIEREGERRAEPDASGVDEADEARSQDRVPAEEIELHLEIDAGGRIHLRVDERESAHLRCAERVGISPRARRRFVLEADARARSRARRAALEHARRRIHELRRFADGWLEDDKSGLDELLRAALVAWTREADEAAATEEPSALEEAIVSFARLAETLPEKLREPLPPLPSPAAESSEPTEPREPSEEAEASEAETVEPVDEVLGDPSEDYGEDEIVAPLFVEVDEDAAQ